MKALRWTGDVIAFVLIGAMFLVYWCVDRTMKVFMGDEKLL